MRIYQASQWFSWEAQPSCYIAEAAEATGPLGKGRRRAANGKNFQHQKFGGRVESSVPEISAIEGATAVVLKCLMSELFVINFLKHGDHTNVNYIRKQTFVEYSGSESGRVFRRLKIRISSCLEGALSDTS